MKQPKIAWNVDHTIEITRDHQFISFGLPREPAQKSGPKFMLRPRAGHKAIVFDRDAVKRRIACGIEMHLAHLEYGATPLDARHEDRGADGLASPAGDHESRLNLHRQAAQPGDDPCPGGKERGVALMLQPSPKVADLADRAGRSQVKFYVVTRGRVPAL